LSIPTKESCRLNLFFLNEHDYEYVNDVTFYESYIIHLCVQVPNLVP
jgi:hypothetical protein